jgi:hypothetical protein
MRRTKRAAAEPKPDRQAMAVKVLRWSVDILRSRAEHLGVIEASNEKAAIEKAAETGAYR